MDKDKDKKFSIDAEWDSSLPEAEPTPENVDYAHGLDDDGRVVVEFTIKRPIPDDPGVAFIEALDLMTRTMLAHPNHHGVAAAFSQDDRDELRAGTPIFEATAYMDLVQRWVSEAKGGP